MRECEWGSEQTFALERPCTVKMLRLRRGGRTPLVRSKRRIDIYSICCGEAILYVEGERWVLRPENAHFVVGARKEHYLEGVTDARVLQVSIGSYRDDSYGVA